MKKEPMKQELANLIHCGEADCEGIGQCPCRTWPPKYEPNKNPRFRSLSGVIRSNNSKAAVVRLTTTRARELLNEFYFELSKYDAEAAERICKKNGA